METNNLFRYLMERARTTHVFSEHMQLDMNAAKNAPKFMLPDDGIILDTGLKGVPAEFKLPFPVVVLEYDDWVEHESVEYFANRKIPARTVKDGELLQKTLVIAREVGNKIELRVVSLIKGQTEQQDILQTPGFTVFMPCTWDGDLTSFIKTMDDSEAVIEVNLEKLEEDAKALRDKFESHFNVAAKVVYLKAMGAVLALIEALSCKNVGHEALPVRKLNKSAAKRGVLPFDEYRVLTINSSKDKGELAGVGGDRHSPREHLRRGHIRTYASGLKVWVQSTVVNAGVGQVLNKDYKIK